MPAYTCVEAAFQHSYICLSWGVFTNSMTNTCFVCLSLLVWVTISLSRIWRESCKRKLIRRLIKVKQLFVTFCVTWHHFNIAHKQQISPYNHFYVVSCAWSLCLIHFIIPQTSSYITAWFISYYFYKVGWWSFYSFRPSPHPPEVPQWLQFIQWKPLGDLLWSRLQARWGILNHHCYCLHGGLCYTTPCDLSVCKPVATGGRCCTHITHLGYVHAAEVKMKKKT